jgi:hypothetical protein
MEFHPSKCQLLRITNKRKPFARDYDIHGHKLEEVESAKYLGVTPYRPEAIACLMPYGFSYTIRNHQQIA